MNRLADLPKCLALLSLIIAGGCGDGGGADELQPPIADLTGTWDVSETLRGDCPGVAYPEVKVYAATVVQSGNDVTLVSGATGATLTGVISGAGVTLSLDVTDGDGTLTGTFPGTVAADGNAFGGLGNWSRTGAVSCTGTSRLAAVRSGTTLPAPAGVSAAAGNSQATLHWAEVIGAVRYNLRRSTTEGQGAAATVVLMSYAPSIVGYQRWLTNGTPYYFTLAAVDATGAEGPLSPEVSATPLASFPRPPTPANVVATAGAGKVTVTCDPVAAATKYSVYRATAPGELTTYAALQGHTNYLASTCTGITMPGLTPGTPYYFAVTAWNEDGESDPSVEVTATPY